MAIGSLGLDSKVLQDLRARALHIVRRSHDPERCLQVMRAKATDLFDFIDLGHAAKDESVLEGPGCAVRQELVHPPAVVVVDKQSAEEPLAEDEVTNEDCGGLVISAFLISV